MVCDIICLQHECVFMIKACDRPRGLNHAQYSIIGAGCNIGLYVVMIYVLFEQY